MMIIRAKGSRDRPGGRCLAAAAETTPTAGPGRAKRIFSSIMIINLIVLMYLAAPDYDTGFDAKIFEEYSAARKMMNPPRAAFERLILTELKISFFIGQRFVNMFD